MSDLQETLKTGGMVPANAKLGKDDAVDVVVARAYQHAVLPGRTVIRLTAESVAIGDDLEMATLGFGAGEGRGAVAKERKRPLGFPGWALVNDPKNARFALDVVKEFKKQARKAKSKPGHAKEGIDAIAVRLGRSAPHFLPSFFEEAGRAFIEHGAQSYAAAMFGKAREAEAVHALEVDEQHRIDGFLEFALAGAVTTKALTQYAKELAEHHEPKTAYAHFRQLCLQRTLGGMPPWSGMSKELGRLAKAAKLDPGAEDAAFIAEIIESPALAKAAGEFWRAYAEPITALGKQSATARGVLLNLFPTGSTYNADLDDAWLDLLDATGAVQGLVADDQSLPRPSGRGSEYPDNVEEAKPNGGRAAWLDRLTQHLARSWRSSKISVRAFALLRRMAPMLVADAKPITCSGRWNRMDLDLVELALELGVPVALPAEHPRLDLGEWAKYAGEPERGRDPLRAAVHPAFSPLLIAAVASELGDEPFDTISRGKAGFLAAKRAWLEGTIVQAEQAALPGLEASLATINSKVKAETFAELPDLYARFAAIDIAPALARSLRVGIIDELGWPALEEAALELDPDGKAELAVHGGPPAIVLVTKTRAIAVGATARLATHDLVIPPNCELATIRYIGGEFLVVMKQGYKVRCYWSSAPHEVWDSPDTSSWSLPALVSNAALLSDGAWIESHTPMRPGERKLALGGTIAACDGTTSWIGEWKDGDYRWREVTASGESGRTSWPAWIEGAADSEWRIHRESHYFPAPGGVTSSPLGVAGGFVGTRIRYQGKTARSVDKVELETIDGTKFVCPKDVIPEDLIKFPDGGEPRPVAHESSYGEGTTMSIYDPSGTFVGSKIGQKDRRYHRGQVAPLTPGFWHMFTPRDVAGSRRIHALTDDDARALMAAVPMASGTPPGVMHPGPVDVTQGVLPELTHPRLRSGVTGFAVMAVEHRLERDRLTTERAPGAATKPGSSGPDDAALLEAVAGWTDRQWSAQGRAWTQIERAGGLFASEDRTDRVIRDAPASTFDWLDLATAPWSLAFIATAIGTPAGKRKVVAELLAHLVGSLPPSDRLRALRVHGEIDVEDDDDDATPPFELRWHAGNAYALRKVGWSGNQYRVLEYAPDGVWKPLPGLLIDAEARGTSGPVLDTAALVTAIALGKTSWSEAGAARLAALTGLTPSEATFLWAGCPKAGDRSANFLDKELRETLGLKAAQAAVARDGINTIPMAKRVAAIDAAGRAGIAALLDGSAVDALAEAWLGVIGKRVAIPEDVVEDAADVKAPMQPSIALAMIANAAEAPELTTDGIFALDKAGEIIRVGKPEPLVGQSTVADESPVFDLRVLETVLAYVPFLYGTLPVGHSLRMQAAVAYDLMRSRLNNPALWIDAESSWMAEEAATAMDRVLEGLGGELLSGFDEGSTGRRLPGVVAIRNAQRVELRVHPATLDARAQTVVGKLTASIQAWGVSVTRTIEYARSDDLVAIVARIAKTPVLVGGWEQNPLASAPKLVDKVVNQLELSRDAAALYLQYLVLLWPTAKHLQQWNGWKPKQLEAALAELVDRDLILVAKRERAQRGHFLPGAWEALKSPHPPMESWKLPFYGTRNATGTPEPRFRRFQALAPFHQLFERAWNRIEAEDVPRYEEVKR